MFVPMHFVVIQIPLISRQEDIMCIGLAG